MRDKISNQMGFFVFISNSMSKWISIRSHNKKKNYQNFIFDVTNAFKIYDYYKHNLAIAFRFNLDLTFK